MTEQNTLTENEARESFDRTDDQLGRWAIFAGGAAFGVMLTALLTWIFG